MQISMFFRMLSSCLLLSFTAFAGEDTLEDEREDVSKNQYYLAQEREYFYTYQNKYLIWTPPSKERVYGTLEVAYSQEFNNNLKNDSFRRNKFAITSHSPQLWTVRGLWGNFLSCVCEDLAIKGKNSLIRKERFEVPNFLKTALEETFPVIKEKKAYIFEKSLYEIKMAEDKARKKDKVQEMLFQMDQMLEKNERKHIECPSSGEDIEGCPPLLEEETREHEDPIKEKKTSSTTIGLGFKSTMGGAAVGGILAGVGFDWVAGSWIQKTVNNWVGKKPLKEEDWTDPDFFEEGEEQVQSQSPLGRLARGVADVMVGTTTFAGLFWILKRI